MGTGFWWPHLPGFGSGVPVKYRGILERSVYLLAKYLSPQGKQKVTRPGFTLLSGIRAQGRHREGHEMGSQGMARSELSCQPVALSNPEADL